MKELDVMKESDTVTIATKLATDTAAKAAELATVTANTAVTLATRTAELSSKTAESMVAISTDIAWMKESLAKIESKLDKVTESFVTAAQHADVLKELEDHEKRVIELEKGRIKVTVLISLGIGVLTLLTSLLIYHLFQQ